MRFSTSLISSAQHLVFRVASQKLSIALDDHLFWIIHLFFLKIDFGPFGRPSVYADSSSVSLFSDALHRIYFHVVG